MKKTILIFLAVILGLSALVGTGFAGYHIGFTRGVISTQDGNKPFFAPSHKFKPGKEKGPKFHKNDSSFEHDGYGRLERGRGFGFSFPIFILFKLALAGIIIWAVYKLFSGYGWQLTLARIPPPISPANSGETPSPKKAGKGK